MQLEESFMGTGFKFWMRLIWQTRVKTNRNRRPIQQGSQAISV